MTIYFTLTFVILVVEMVVFGLLVLPLPSRWRRAILKFASTSPLVNKGLTTLKIVFGFIFLLFIDTVNRLQRIGTEEADQPTHHHHGHEAELKAKTFYAQRNMYLTGFTLFLSVILERTSTLVVQVLQREEELERVKQDAHSAGQDKQRLINTEQTFQLQISELNSEIKRLKQEQLDFATLKKQADQMQLEYNRLADEHNRLEKDTEGTVVEEKKDV
ncbi:B-cell receptor-associated protein 31-like-domain-containing protein [Spinellus fusiger]|nr:B-cell receptor-associated protein 31-like-domain-containing protein [Spinellus fusiger]